MVRIVSTKNIGLDLRSLTVSEYDLADNGLDQTDIEQLNANPEPPKTEAVVTAKPISGGYKIL